MTMFFYYMYFKSYYFESDFCEFGLYIVTFSFSHIHITHMSLK